MKDSPPSASPASRRRRLYGLVIIAGLVLVVIGGVMLLTPKDNPRPVDSTDLRNPSKKESAMQLVSSAENSSLDWRAQYKYIEDIDDGRGYTAGIIGFCSGTGDMLQLVRNYTAAVPNNKLAPYLPALEAVDGTDSHEGLDPGFPAAWRAAAADPQFRLAQDELRDQLYFDPAVTLAKQDGLRALGQFAYYDAAVMHGAEGEGGLRDIRKAAIQQAKPPANGGDERAYLQAFLAARKAEMRKEPAHRDLSRITDVQEAFLDGGNLDLQRPLEWQVYGDAYSLR